MARSRKPQTSSDDNANLPDPKSTPDQVRAFLTTLMRDRGLTLEEAKRIAGQWKYGTGRELRSYPIAMYRNIFGPEEDGWAVCMAVKTRVHRERERERIERSWRRSTRVSIVVVCGAYVLAVLATIIAMVGDPYENVPAVLKGYETTIVFFGLFSGCAAAFIGISQGVQIAEERERARTSPAEMAEKDLVEHW